MTNQPDFFSSFLQWVYSVLGLLVNDQLFIQISFYIRSKPKPENSFWSQPESRKKFHWAANWSKPDKISVGTQPAWTWKFRSKSTHNPTQTQQLQKNIKPLLSNHIYLSNEMSLNRNLNLIVKWKFQAHIGLHVDRNYFVVLRLGYGSIFFREMGVGGRLLMSMKIILSSSAQFAGSLQMKFSCSDWVASWRKLFCHAQVVLRFDGIVLSSFVWNFWVCSIDGNYWKLFCCLGSDCS